MKKNYFLLLLVTTLFCKAQNPGEVAQNFGAFLGVNTGISTITTQIDGKFLLGGGFTIYNNVVESSIIRLNADGTKDTSFNTTGTGFNGTINSIAVQSDGKILAGGQFLTYNGETVNRIIRFNADGTRDTAFNTGTGFNNTVRSITLQSDGKILVGGDFTTFNAVTQNRIIRLNADGSKDTSFTIGTGFNGGVNSIAIQTDGKILVGGSFSSYIGVTANRIIRLNADGTRDTSFTTGTGLNGATISIAVQTDGKIILGGVFTLYNGIASNNLIRLNTDGTINTAGTGINGSVTTIAVQSDGKVVLGGNFTTVNSLTANRIVRLNADGTNDPSFISGSGFDTTVNSIVVQSDAKILVGGNFATYNGIIENKFTRLNTDGTKDTALTSQLGTGFDAGIIPIKTQGDGKILLGGGFTIYNGLIENRIIRLNTNGTKDTSFNVGTGFNNTTRTILVQGDGKIIVGGDFSSFNGLNETRIIRLNADGTKDTSFTTGTGFNQAPLSMALQSDGKILIVGVFTLYNGVTENRIIRLNPNGTKDTSFATGTGFDNLFVYSIAIQTDGKILVVGEFTTYNGVSANKIIRLNTDGTRDATFTIGTGFTGDAFGPQFITTQTDGKILVGGDFTIYNGVTESNIIRLNADGTKDTSFNPGTGFTGVVSTILEQNNGKILVGGRFTAYNGISENKIIRLNANGTKDTAFITGTGFNVRDSNIVYSFSMQADGSVLVGGVFTSYNNSNASHHLISLNANESLSNGNVPAQDTFSLWPNPVKDILYIEASNSNTIVSVKLYDLQGKLVNENAFENNNAISVSNLPAGLYLVKIKTTEGEFNRKFIKE